MTLDELLSKNCRELPKGTPTLTPAEVRQRMPLVPGWELSDDGKALRRQHRFADFVSAVGFIDRLAVLAEAEGHHPDLRLWGYRNLEVVFSTHSIGGLSENDFIMAAKTNRLEN
ncbi:MAG TPA: 4a-hydroxytetrahydrobiopterin dehydratase [Dehalococcoidia bacterium]|nr:4a-hydroxytetrahydrobiopterin dehydratase [Dehalococcoidia bacterium]